MKRLWYGFAAGVLCALALHGPAFAQVAEPIRIGMILPVTGPFAELGLNAKTGIEFRVQEAGATVAGRSVRLILGDEAAQPSVALDQGKKLVEQDRVHLVIGPFVSGPRLAVEPYFAEHKMSTLTVSNHTPAAKKFGWTLFTRGTLWQVPHPMGAYAAEQLRLKTVVTLAQDFVAARAYIDHFVESFKEKGGSVVQQHWTTVGKGDFGPYLVAMKDADALAVFLAGADILSFLKQYAEFGLQKKKLRLLLPQASVLEESHVQALGDVTVGIVGSNDYVRALDTPANKKFVTAFEQKHGKRAERTHAAGYEAASIALTALEATRGDTTPEKLRAALLQVKLDAPSGRVSFTPSGIAIRDVHISEIKKVGNEYAWIPLKTYPQVIQPGD
jgi:branched-chain amino acid transport system substrate-binding protein